jgi:indolepyruvate ferredoxin oxidoreductase alpha subunit
MIESGTRVVSSYPGSPTPEIADAINAIPSDERPFYFEFSTNEKVATEVAYGAAVNGHLSAVFFKSVGLNVAADTFVQLNHMNIIGGMVVVLGDDPGANSSQNEQDNRHMARMSYTPVLEPASPREAYAFFKVAVEMSVAHGMPVIVRMTTHVCHAKEKVHFEGWRSTTPNNTPRFDAANGPYIPIAAEHVHPMKRRAIERRDAVAALAENGRLNTVLDNHNPDRGIITMGLPFLSVCDALAEAADPPDVLKIGMVYPLPRERIAAFLAAHDTVKIVEELDDIVEREVKALAFDTGMTTRIIGKVDTEDWIGEYAPDKVYDILHKTWPEMLPERPTLSRDLSTAPDRLPQMCPGCGHRSAFHAIKAALKGTDITVADIGCHTLGFQPPYRLGELLMCMGASTGIGAGMSLFNDTRKVVVFLGDSTFFHAGLPGIVNAVFNRHNITLVLMENGTTAMTGHQDHAASGRNFNAPTDNIPVRQVLEGLGVRHIYEIDTYQQSKLTDLVGRALADDAFSVVIARHPCMLKFMRAQRKKPGFAPRAVHIDQDACQRIHRCVSEFGCPTFQLRGDGQVDVNPDLCIGDASCVQTCPAKAIENKPGKKRR